MTAIEQNQNSARKKSLRRARGSYANAFGTATLVTSNLLILAASNVLFPAISSNHESACLLIGCKSRQGDSAPFSRSQAVKKNIYQ